MYNYLEDFINKMNKVDLQKKKCIMYNLFYIKSSLVYLEVSREKIVLFGGYCFFLQYIINIQVREFRK